MLAAIAVGPGGGGGGLLKLLGGWVVGAEPGVGRGWGGGGGGGGGGGVYINSRCLVAARV